MRALSKTFALAVSLAPVVAGAAPATFVRDGTTYTYSVSQDGPARIIDGTGSDGSRYHLIVANGRVTGTSNSSPVRFSLRDVVTTVRSKTETASR